MESVNKGNLYFFTGLSGAGKTTVGGLFYRRLKAKNPATVLLDGDQIRPVFGDSIGYEPADRLLLGERTFRVSRMLTEQGIDVVLCAICMFSSVRRWARENIPGYREIYLKVTRETLFLRDQKGLYSSGAKNVVGIDLAFDEPDSADFVIENDGAESPESIVARLEAAFGL